MDCHFLLQGIFPILGSNSGLLHCRQILYRPSHQGSTQVLGKNKVDSLSLTQNPCAVQGRLGVPAFPGETENVGQLALSGWHPPLPVSAKQLSPAKGSLGQGGMWSSQERNKLTRLARLTAPMAEGERRLLTLTHKRETQHWQAQKPGPGPIQLPNKCFLIKT